MGRKLGQHFLRSAPVLGRIVALAALAPGEPVLEIGPGRGALTGRLLAAGARVTAIEIDPALCAALRARWEGEPAFRLIEADILRADLAPEALFGTPARYVVVANLPYYLSSPLLFRLMAERERLARLVLMVQREIAERLLAEPGGGKDYGSLSICAQHAFLLRRGFAVPPGAFDPPPKVHSAVVALEPRPRRLAPEREARFLAHIQRLFMNRRKLMLSNLRRLYPDAGADWAELGRRVERARAEALTPAEHLAVFEALYGAVAPQGLGGG
ncbi:MAG: ribosomal RNA small subunit methyltransferase A [Candidatus Lambdaproteobacteria bacterium]|nr:ribosomal RNA small subunit methyltransferase A [Candidatus Lambdaproteobacteria bacterium]